MPLSETATSDLLARASRVINLARRLKARDQREKSESMFRHALVIRRQAVGSEHPLTAAAATHLGRLLEETGQLPEAEALYREALVGFRATLPAEHSYLILAIRNLAAVICESSDARRGEAGPLLRECVELARKADPADAGNLAECLSDLGSYLADEGDLAAAEPLLAESLHLHRHLAAADGIDLANVLVRMARLQRAQGNAAAAELAAREALELRRRNHPEDDHRVAKAKSLLGAALVDLGQYQEAEVLLLAAYQTLQATRGALGSGPPRLADTMGRIAMLYDRWGKAEQAAHWRSGVETCCWVALTAGSRSPV